MDLSLTTLQLDILCVLWSRGEATVSEIRKALLDQRDAASSTIHTLLARLEDRGVVTHRSDGKRHYFSALVPREEVKEAVVAEFCGRTRRLFQGSSTKVVEWILKAQEVDPSERESLREVLEGEVVGLSG